MNDFKMNWEEDDQECSYASKLYEKVLQQKYSKKKSPRDYLPTATNKKTVEIPFQKASPETVAREMAKMRAIMRGENPDD